MMERASHSDRQARQTYFVPSRNSSLLFFSISFYRWIAYISMASEQHTEKSLLLHNCAHYNLNKSHCFKTCEVFFYLFFLL